MLAKTRELEEAKQRIQALDRIIQNLYEDKVRGSLTEERFVKLSTSYEQEQAELSEKVSALKQELLRAKEQSNNTEKFIRIVRKYTEIPELTPEIVREFVHKVIVHQAEKVDGKRTQMIELYFNYVGQVILPTQDIREAV